MNLKFEFQCLTEVNEHTAAAKLLVDTFGTDDEKQIIKEIAERHEKLGYLTMEDSRQRFEISNKYYKNL